MNSRRILILRRDGSTNPQIPVEMTAGGGSRLILRTGYWVRTARKGHPDGREPWPRSEPGLRHAPPAARDRTAPSQHLDRLAWLAAAARKVCREKLQTAQPALRARRRL